MYTVSNSGVTVGTSNTLLASKSLPAGTYMLLAEFYVPSGYSGEINCFITVGSASGTVLGTTRIRKSVTGSSCRIQTMTITTINSTTAICIVGKLGSSVSGCEGVLKAVRIK